MPSFEDVHCGTSVGGSRSGGSKNRIALAASRWRAPQAEQTPDASSRRSGGTCCSSGARCRTRPRAACLMRQTAPGCVRRTRSCSGNASACECALHVSSYVPPGAARSGAWPNRGFCEAPLADPSVALLHHSRPTAFEARSLRTISSSDRVSDFDG